MEVFTRVRALGGMESKIIKVGFEISFGTRILIFLCPLAVTNDVWLCTGEPRTSCIGCWSQTVPTSRTIAAFLTSSIQSSHQDPLPGLVKDLCREGGQTPPILTQHTQIRPRTLHYFFALCFTSTKISLIRLHR